MTCRDRNRIALQSDLIGALALGLRNILVLSGDDPKAGNQPETKPVFDLDSRALLALAQRIGRERMLPPEQPIKGPTALFSRRRRPAGRSAAGLGFRPGSWPRWRPARDFVQTQFCLDTGLVRRWAARLGEHGLAGRVSLLIGVAPIPSARSARWMREKLFGTIIPDAVSPGSSRPPIRGAKASGFAPS